MAGVRRGARAVLRYYVPLFALAMVVQIFLAGEGIFGIKKGPKLDDQHTLNAHRDFGWALTQFGGAVLLLATLLAWQRPLRRRVGLFVVLCLLGFPLQPLLAAGGEHHKYVGMFHPVNAILLLGLSGYLAHRAWTKERAAAPVPEAAAAVPTPT